MYVRILRTSLMSGIITVAAASLPDSPRGIDADCDESDLTVCGVQSAGDCRYNSFPDPNDPVELHMAALGLRIDGDLTDGMAIGAVAIVDTVPDLSGTPPGVSGDQEQPRAAGDPNGFNVARSVLLFQPDSDLNDGLDDSFLYVGWDLSDFDDGDGLLPRPFDSDDNDCASTSAIAMVADDAAESYICELQACTSAEAFNPATLARRNPLDIASLAGQDVFVELLINERAFHGLILLKPPGLDAITFPTSDPGYNPSNACIDKEINTCARGRNVEMIIKAVETSGVFGPHPAPVVPDSDEARQNRFALARLLGRLRAISTGADGNQEFANASLHTSMPDVEGAIRVRFAETGDEFSKNVPVLPGSSVEFEITITNFGNEDLEVTVTDVMPAIGSQAGFVTFDPICETLEAFLTSPRRGLSDEPVDGVNALGLGLDPAFFADLCANLSVGFLGSIRNNSSALFGRLLGVELERDDAGACQFTDGDTLVLRFMAEVDVTDENQFCAVAVSPDCRNALTVTGTLVGATDIVASDEYDVIDTIRETKTEADDNVATVNIACCRDGNIIEPIGDDCNDSDIADICDILIGTSLDCNNNEMPDDCEPDCNDNGVSDECDIEGDMSEDCQLNSVPDECEIDENSPAPGGPFSCTDNCDPDCNENGLPDGCDIDEERSGDCDGNGIPDECDIASERQADCNANGAPDVCDVPPSTDFPDGVCTGQGCSVDCNENGVPDECEIDRAGDMPGGPFFCDPDVSTCDLDCNNNGKPDRCDIDDCPDGDHDCEDCQGDEIPDGCQMAETGVSSTWVGGHGCDADPEHDCWDIDTNWCPAIVPENVVGTTFKVRICAPPPAGGGCVLNTVVTLDISPSIAALTIGEAATLQVDQLSGADARSIFVEDSDDPKEAPGAIINNGTIRALHGKRLVIDAADIDQTGGGSLCADGAQDGTPSRIEINGRQVEGGRVVARNGGLIELTSGGQLVDVLVEGDVFVDNVLVPAGETGVLVGVILNEGVIAVGATDADSATFLVPDLAGTELSGSGCVAMKSRLSRLGEFKGSFTNRAGHRIEGAGRIFGVFTNGVGGSVIANHPSDTLTIMSPGYKVNGGLLVASDDGALSIEGPIEQTETGVIEATGSGTVAVHADVTGVGAFCVSCPTGTAATTGGGCTPPPKMVVADGVSIMGASLEISNEGVVEVQGSASIDLTGTVTIDFDGIYQGSTSAQGSPTASLFAEKAKLCAGHMILRGSMTLNVQDDMELDMPMMTQPGSPAVRLGVCLPPPGSSVLYPPSELSVLDSASVHVGGALQLLDSEVEIQVGPNATFTLAGDFDNQSTTPESFHWVSGALTMESKQGTAEPTTQSFEVAGEDRGADPSGYVGNFSMGTVEIASGSSVRFVDLFDNDDDGQAECSEALYVRTLILRPGSSITIENCRVYYGVLVDEGADLTIVGCGEYAHEPSCGFDQNGHVDLDDLVFFEICLSISGPKHSPDCQECVEVFDTDLDGDVDMADFRDFQRVFTGISP